MVTEHIVYGGCITFLIPRILQVYHFFQSGSIYNTPAGDHNHIFQDLQIFTNKKIFQYVSSEHTEEDQLYPTVLFFDPPDQVGVGVDRVRL